MFRFFRTLGLCVAVALLVVTAASAFELYSPAGTYPGDYYQLFGTASIGKARSQHFCPTLAQNPLLATDTFDRAGFKVRLETAGEILTFNLKLFAWNTDYATTIAGAPIGQTLNVVKTTPAEDWVYVDCAPQSAAGQYLLYLYVVNYQNADTGWQLYKRYDNMGGTNNDAFNDATLQTTREYIVDLNVVPVPEPSSFAVLGLGLLPILRKIRR